MREESVDFDTTKNLFIEGDNLEALKLLQESYLGKVKLIYIDPPYNTGNDLVYRGRLRRGSSSEYLVNSGQQVDDWRSARGKPRVERPIPLGLARMMYPRLKLARNLLARTASCASALTTPRVQTSRATGQVLSPELPRQMWWRTPLAQDGHAQQGTIVKNASSLRLQGSAHLTLSGTRSARRRRRLRHSSVWLNDEWNPRSVGAELLADTKVGADIRGSALSTSPGSA